jgi:uncharacterized MnhB-related membrane protein
MLCLLESFSTQALRACDIAINHALMGRVSAAPA